MKVLVVGGGGREHALVRALAKSAHVETLWCAPGNDGIAQEATCVAVKADDLPGLFNFAQQNAVDLTVVGPEVPLVLGLTDYFRRGGLAVVGPTKSAARLEGSKSFAKQFMRQHGIPTARYDVIPSLERGIHVLSHWKGRSVVKADGLAAGKGVQVCESREDAKAFLYEVMEKQIFGAAGSTVIIEECLEGQEATVMAFCDGHTLVPMPACQDHKRIFDGDQGPNTGGMGAYAPAPVVTPTLQKQIERDIFEPFMRGLKSEQFDYRGIIYFGLMITAAGPYVLEFNVRLGDPETQAVLPLLEGDLALILRGVAEQQLSKSQVRWKRESALCVVVSSAGYPGPYETGKTIEGLEQAARVDEVSVFHAGTEKKNAQWTTHGGRVLGVTGLGASLEAARDRAYEAVSDLSFEGMHYRKDIGAKAMRTRAIF